ncbi:MAG: hypothetical protein OQK24_09470 [Magnetovibrio sp.]|nr:hypothetical protein [Magnetovibrio sp.]
MVFDNPKTFPPQDEVWSDSRQGQTVWNERLVHFPKDRDANQKHD